MLLLCEARLLILSHSLPVLLNPLSAAPAGTVLNLATVSDTPELNQMIPG